MNRTVIGIDVGGTTTKIVGFKKSAEAIELIAPQLVQAADPLTSIYGALGKFTAENGLGLSDIDRILMTGAGASVVKEQIYNLKTVVVPEFSGIGIGGLYLSELSDAIVVSMGTGTALVHAQKKNGKYTVEYLGGTGVGGGTLIGLSRRMLGIDNVEHLEQLYAAGNLDNVDLRVKDIAQNHVYGEMNENLTAANFGKLSDMAGKADVALGIANMVAETVATLSIFAARNFGLKEIVLIGNLTTMDAIRKTFASLSEIFGVRFIIPKNSQYGTVIGAALNEEQ